MKVLAVARFTLLRLFRSRYLAAGLLLLGLVAVFFLFSSERSGGRLHFTHGLAWAVTWLMSIWLGLEVVNADRLDGTLRSTLTRPTSLVETVLGKLLGAWAYVALLAVGFTLVICLAALFKDVKVTWSCLTYQVHLLPVYLTVMALALLLAQLLPRFAAGFFMLFAWDHWLLEKTQSLAAELPALPGDMLVGLGKMLYHLLPPTSKFFLSYKDYASHDLSVWVYLLLVAFSIHFALAACLLAGWLLSRQEL